jgi:hypothetical protein
MRNQLLRKEHEKLAINHKEARYRFILTELDLAITFCDLALSAKDQVRTTRNTENAREAYKAATHFLEDAHFSLKMRAAVQERVSRLKVLLRELNRRENNFASPKPAGAL